MFSYKRSALKPGQKVRVTGKINADGDLDASVVVIGDVLSAKGTVVTSVNDDSLFPLLLDPGQELIGDQVNVEITKQLLFYWDVMKKSIGSDTEGQTSTSRR